MGFAIYVDDLMKALARNKIETEIEYTQNLILFEREDQEAAIRLASELRDKGQTTMLIRKSERHSVEEYRDYAKKRGFAEFICVSEQTKED